MNPYNSKVYTFKSAGLNLQKNCHHTHLLEGAANLGTLAQAAERARRFGNPSPVVYLYEYYVPGTFDDKNVWRNIEKAVPQAMANTRPQTASNPGAAGDQVVITGDETNGELTVTGADGTVHRYILVRTDRSLVGTVEGLV